MIPGFSPAEYNGTKNMEKLKNRTVPLKKPGKSPGQFSEESKMPVRGQSRDSLWHSQRVKRVRKGRGSQRMPKCLGRTRTSREQMRPREGQDVCRDSTSVVWERARLRRAEVTGSKNPRKDPVKGK